MSLLEKKRMLKRECCPTLIAKSERPKLIDALLDNIQDSYKETFIKLIDDYDKKTWRQYQVEP